MIEVSRYGAKVMDFWSTDMKQQTHLGEYLNIAFPAYSAEHCIQHVEDLDVSYFTQGSVVSSKVGSKEIDSVVYTDPITGYQHNFNAVQHGKLSGSVLLNFPEMSEYPLNDRGKNYFTKTNKKAMASWGETLICPKTDQGMGPNWHGYYMIQPMYLGDIGLSQGSGTMRVIVVGWATACLTYLEGRSTAEYTAWVNFELRSLRVPSYNTGDYTLRYTKSWGGTTYGRPGFEQSPRNLSQAKQWFENECAKIIGISGTLCREAGFNANLNGYTSNNDVQTRIADGRIQDMRFWPDASLSPLRNFDFRNFVVDTPAGLWNELSNEALDSLKGFDGNGIAFVKDAKEFLPTVNGFVQSLRDIAPKNFVFKRSKKKYINFVSGNSIVTREIPNSSKIVKRKNWSWLTPKQVKAISDAYLGMHYGLSLTYSDTKDLLETLEDLPFNATLSRVQAARSFTTGSVVSPMIQSCSTTARYQIFYDPSANLKHPVNNLIQQMDLFPTLENMWDMVPFSFVVDWFLDLQEQLNAIDNSFSMLRSRYEVAACGQSLKSTFKLNMKALGLNHLCNITGTMYTRKYKQFAETPMPGDSSPTSPLHHWVEGTALIVSNN